MDYITTQTVTAIFGAGWQGASDADRAVMMANAWLNAERLPTYTEGTVPQPILRAGAEIAREAATGSLYAAQGVEVIEKSVEAKGVKSSKKFAQGSKAVSHAELLAKSLIAPYKTFGFAINAPMERV